MAVSQPDPVSELVALVTLSIRNWILALPNFVVTILAFVPLLLLGGAGLLSMFFSGGFSTDPLSAAAAMLPSLVAGLVISAILGIVLGIIGSAATYAGAGDALRGLPIDLGALLQRGTSYFGTIFVYFLICAAVGIAVELIVGVLTAITAGILGFILIPLLFCAAIAAAYFLMYSLPAMVLGNRKAIEAIKESFNLAYANVGRSLTAVAGLIVAGIGCWIVVMVLHFIPVIGTIASFAVFGVYGVVQAVVLSKFYLELSGKGAGQTMPTVAG